MARASVREAICPDFEDHTPCPEGYIEWHTWAETMGKTHRQRKCRGCNRFSIWEPRKMKAPTNG